MVAVGLLILTTVFQSTLSIMTWYAKDVSKAAPGPPGAGPQGLFPDIVEQISTCTFR